MLIIPNQIRTLTKKILKEVDLLDSTERSITHRICEHLNCASTRAMLKISTIVVKCIKEYKLQLLILKEEHVLEVNVIINEVEFTDYRGQIYEHLIYTRYSPATVVLEDTVNKQYGPKPRKKWDNQQ